MRTLQSFIWHHHTTNIHVALITARIRRMGEGTVFSLFVSSHLGGVLPQSGLGGVPHLRSGRGGTPSQVWLGGYPIPGLGGRGYPILGLDGVPPPTRSGWGTSLPRPGMGYPPRPGTGNPPGTWEGLPPLQTWDWVPPPTWDIASTCYVAGGMPLAFTQEDFLVFSILVSGCYDRPSAFFIGHQFSCSPSLPLSRSSVLPKLRSLPKL